MRQKKKIHKFSNIFAIDDIKQSLINILIIALRGVKFSESISSSEFIIKRNNSSIKKKMTNLKRYRFPSGSVVKIFLICFSCRDLNYI